MPIVDLPSASAESPTRPKLLCDTCYGSLAIDGISLHIPEAWCAPDLSSLWGTSEIRGSDRLIPGDVGTVAYPRRKTITRVSLPFLVIGNANQDGDPWPDLFFGFQQNMTYLSTNLFAKVTTGDGTREAVWTLPDGSEISADVHVLAYQPQLLPGPIARGTLELNDPAGALHLA